MGGHFEIENEEETAFSELRIPFDTILPIRETSELSAFVKNIFFEQHSQSIHKNHVIRRYFDLLLFEISERIHEKSKKQEHPLYKQFYRLRGDIRLAPQGDWNIDLICKKMMISRSHIQHLYKSFFSTSIVADVQSGRIEYAKYLLSATDMTVTAISHACGYENDVHFMRLFKKSTGITPSEYRKRN